MFRAFVTNRRFVFSGAISVGILSALLFLISTHSGNAEELQSIESSQVATDSLFSMWSLSLLIFYCIVIAACSIFGGTLSTRIKLTHLQIQLVMSFVGGIMLGTGIFHIIPQALDNLGWDSIDSVSLAMMIGMIAMFLMLRAFQFHQHGSADFSDAISASTCDHKQSDPELGDEHVHKAHNPHAHTMSGPGVFLGMAIHTIIDGMALAASFQAEMIHSSANVLFAFGTFLAIALHIPLDAVTVTSSMIAGKWSKGWTNFVNILFSMMCPIGVLLFVVGVNSLFSDPNIFVGYALAFAAGVFICVALSDLLPEMEFHSHNRVALTVALLIGIGVSWSIRYLAPDRSDFPKPKQVSVMQDELVPITLEVSKVSSSSDP